MWDFISSSVLKDAPHSHLRFFISLTSLIYILLAYKNKKVKESLRTDIYPNLRYDFVEDMELKLRMSGMTCERCAQAVERSVLNLKGIKSVNVNLESEMVIITSVGEIERKALIHAIEESGKPLHTFKVIAVENIAPN